MYFSVSFSFVHSRDIFRVEGFPYRVIYCNDLLYVFLTHNIVNFFINFTCLTATYLSKACYSLFVPDVPLNPSQSINLVLRVSIMSL